MERLTAASRTMTALCNAKVPISLDSSKGYVHRTSAMRGESRGAQWTGKEHTFKAEEAWAIRGCLHPAWREYIEDQSVFAEWFCHPETLDFLRRWSGVSPEKDPMTMCDATLFVNPREAHFSEGWHRCVLDNLLCGCTQSAECSSAAQGHALARGV